MAAGRSLSSNHFSQGKKKKSGLCGDVHGASCWLVVSSPVCCNYCGSQRVLVPQEEDLVFRQRPVLEDCFPSSEKCWKEVEHEGEVLRVSFPAEAQQLSLCRH